MGIKEIKQTIHDAIESNDQDTMYYYAEHCAESLGVMTEALCLAIMDTGIMDWAAVMSVAARKTPALSDALGAICVHICTQRNSFIESHAHKLQADADKHNQAAAELNAKLDGVR